MTLTLPDLWKEAYSKANPEPVYLAEIEVGVRAYLTVLDYSLLSVPTDEVSITYDGNTHDFSTANWTPETSNEQSALNLLERMLDTIESEAAYNDLLAYTDGDLLTVIGPAGMTLSAGTTNASAIAVTPDADATGSIKWISGSKFHRPRVSSATLEADPVITAVSAMTAEIDPIERVFKSGDRHMTLADESGGPIRNLLGVYPDLKGKIVTLKLGEADIDETDFVGDGKYVIDEIEVGGFDSPEATIRLKDVGGLLEDAEITLEVLALHPLEVIEAILVRVGVPTALYDATTLDPTNYSTIGHWNMSRLWSSDSADFGNFRNAINEPTNALDLVNELLLLLNGSFVPDEDGIFSFKLFDLEEVAVRTITDDEVEDFQQLGAWNDVVNHVAITGCPWQGEELDLFDRGDRSSQYRFGTPGQGPLVKSDSWKTDWLNGIANVQESFGTSATEILLGQAAKAGFSGSKFDDISTSQPTYAAPSADRLVYLLVFSISENQVHTPEIISCDGITRLYTHASLGAGYSSFRGVGDPSLPTLVEYSIAGRGLFGTTHRATDWWIVNETFAVDITLAVAFVHAKLARLALGLPMVEITLDHTHYDLQIGDHLTASFDRFLDHGRDGATTSNMRWEIVGKEPTTLDDSPGVKLTLAGIYLKESVVPLTGVWTPPRVYIDIITDLWTDGIVTNDGEMITDNDGNFIRGW